MDEKDPIIEALTDAEAQLQRLKARDQLSTDAQLVFAELGSRVDAVLEERRSGRDRRAQARAEAEERRHATQP